MKAVADHSVPTLSPDLLGSDPSPYWDNCDNAYLAALWEEPVTYVVQFTQALDSVTAGYFLSCYIALYQPGEWIALNEDIVRRETGLGSSSWYRVRHLLLDAGILVNERRLNVSLYCLDGEHLEGLLRRNSDLSLCAVAGPPVSLNRLHLKTLLYYGLSVKACLLLAAVQADTPHTALAAGLQPLGTITRTGRYRAHLAEPPRTEAGGRGTARNRCAGNQVRWLSKNAPLPLQPAAAGRTGRRLYAVADSINRNRNMDKATSSNSSTALEIGLMRHQTISGDGKTRAHLFLAVCREQVEATDDTMRCSRG